ncbi:3D domain-containing protein [Priestia taiwanensis]|uniref:Cell wall-binding protein n=1 Tax=Priestia taiwanensis TaxID=1347902 RepID=A0A917AU55_9BACI|nr:3D domain-containing protein [Priestia taiwanensis]MBM7363907.1 3D (Asp-Asp-Asp) domain-containing protein/Skp family chaperone for outer membrane proteins [Priestia taiwanensis]GGE70007.1 cell wall-binding protein [Priestia taiwanensis]
MTMKKVLSSFLITCIIFMSINVQGTAHAEQSNNELIHIEQQLRDQHSGLKEMQEEKEAMLKEVQKIQDDVKALDGSIMKNQQELVAIENKIAEASALIEQKKEEIIEVSNKILERKEIMKKRMVSMQQNPQEDIFVELMTTAESIMDIVKRYTYMSQIFNSDEDLFRTQEEDLESIEQDKEVIAKQEELLKKEEQALQKKQEELRAQYDAVQASLQEAEKKHNDAASALTDATTQADQLKAQKTALEEKAKAMQELEKKQSEVVPQQPSVPVDGQSIKGREMYVEATAYTPAESQGAHAITKYGGYNILAKPTPRLIAIDPRVIPPLSKVYVEGYGYAIAADTGGAIKGYKIDVLLPTNEEAYRWGRKKVKLTIIE